MTGDSAALIWRFIDGKPGHENQSAALVEALQRLGPFRERVIPVDAFRWRDLLRRVPLADRPALVVGAGHRTHGALLAAARRFGCPSVVLMNPSLPTAMFDLCLVPRHDLPPGRPAPDHVLATRGMLNRIPPDLPAKDDTGLILLGGPSKHHGWDEMLVRDAVARITTAGTGLDWHLTDSRRTPAATLAALPAGSFTMHPHRDTGPDWLPSRLATARDVWVTEDSMSMIYEALTARCGVGLLPVPVHTPQSRVVRGVQQLAADAWVTRFSDWDGGRLDPPPETLHEATRCARAVLQRFFPARA